jgi:hypothetical protein
MYSTSAQEGAVIISVEAQWKTVVRTAMIIRVGWGDNSSGDSDNNYYDSETMSIREELLASTITQSRIF